MHRDPVNYSQDSEKVVSIFRGESKQTDEKDEVNPDSEESFLDVMKKNMTNKARLAKERTKANKNVIRSHRLKR